MKKLLFTALLAVSATIGGSYASAQEVTTQAGAKIEFTKDTHDYGNVKYGGNGVCTFSFKNTGTEPLIISQAKGSCGCTVPEWTTDPIAPGETGTITVKYNTEKVGAINKSVTVTSNAVNEPTKTLRIKGNVAAAPEGTSPVNTTGVPPAN
jgi:hypothetical protein